MVYPLTDAQTACKLAHLRVALNLAIEFVRSLVMAVARETLF